MDNAGALIAPTLRLHFGDEGIDEVLTMGVTAWQQLIDDLSTSEAAFRATFETWVDASGTGASSAAKAKKAEFSKAAWRSFGKT